MLAPLGTPLFFSVSEMVMMGWASMAVYNQAKRFVVEIWSIIFPHENALGGQCSAGLLAAR